MIYRRCGASGVDLPALSLGLWHNFGAERPFMDQPALLRHAFDNGITHFDLANNYGPPPGEAESNFGRVLRSDLAGHRDEMFISTKAGYDMWSGPHGAWSSRKHLLASLDQSLRRLGVDYVDVFYSHRFDPRTPLEETMSALEAAVRAGKALYVGISSYSARRTESACDLLSAFGIPLLVHQASYSMFNRWVEDELLDVLFRRGVGCIGFSPLAQGLLTGRYLHGIPDGARAAHGTSLDPARYLTEDNLARVRALSDIARDRGQSLAQLALAWTLRDDRISSVVIGASSRTQLDENLGALDHLEFTQDELDRVDAFAVDGNVNIWSRSSQS